MSELKPGWKRVKFGDLAECVNDRVDDPSKAGVDRYVGLDHLDPENLTIRRWGTPEDVESTKLRFKPGDIIFGKRRAYQRKLAVADFEGICSAHAMVLRAKPNAVVPEFLPFFMQSELFMERAIAISVGSLSPTINWKTLAAEEFALPPPQEQRRLVQLLSAADIAWRSLVDATMASEVAATALVQNFIAQSKTFAPIGNVISDISYGCSMKSSSEQRGFPILRIPNVLRGDLDLTDMQWVELTDADRERFSVRAGDVLLVRTNGNPNYVGRSVYISHDVGAMAYASYLLRLRVKPELVRPSFLSALINAPTTRRGLRGSVKSSAGNYNINTGGVKSQNIPSCTLAEQDVLVEQLQALRDAHKRLGERAAAAKTLCRVLLQREATS